MPQPSQSPRIVIYTGGRLGPRAAALAQSCDVLIGADRGALFLIEHGFRPHLAIGDFDSVTPEQLETIRRSSIETECCDPIAKDYTDTELAYNRALAMHPGSIVIAGGLGTRFDHTLANVHLLVRALERGIEASVTDEHNDVRLISDSVTLLRADYTAVSLLPLTPVAAGITLEGFRYPLQDATLTIGQSLGISNVLEAERGRVTLKDGLLLVIQSRD